MVIATLIWAANTLTHAIPVAAQDNVYEVLSTPDHVIWGELFKPDSEPILRVQSGDRIRMQTISHEGILPDQGDTIEFLTKGGIAKDDILADQLTVKTKPDALLYGSAAIDFEVSQVVDIVKGIHGGIPKESFAALKAE